MKINFGKLPYQCMSFSYANHSVNQILYAQSLKAFIDIILKMKTIAFHNCYSSQMCNLHRCEQKYRFQAF